MIVDVQNLTKSFGKNQVVKGVSIQVQRGEIFGFLGANGSGKTTTIRMICGLLTPDSGSGSCLGFDVLKQSVLIKAKVGYMPHKFSLYNELSVLENLEFIAQIYLVDDANKKIATTLSKLKLNDKTNQLAGELSGGWRQRLSFAACLIHEPELLLLDEPTAGIDPLARRDFWDLIHELSEKGVTILMSTHYMDEAERCHHLAYLSEGKVLVKGRVHDVIQSTGIYTYQLIGELPASLLTQLKSLSSVVQAAWFGRSFHICTRDAPGLALALDELRHSFAFNYTLIESSLEDAFITLGGHN